jgi:GNAT superfamily N-acetyltransferase
MQLKEISAEDTYSIRGEMLRKGRPPETRKLEGDHDELTFHLGGFVKGKLVSVASFYFKHNPQLPGEHHFQLRGMATLSQFQGKGLSSALLKRAIPIIKNNHCSHIWCNARLVAKGFYEKVGFKAISDSFEIEPIGPHVLMQFDL